MRKADSAWMCRRYSRGSKDIRSFGQYMGTDEGRQRLGGHYFDAVLEPLLQQIDQCHEVVERLLGRVELHQNIHVAIGARLISEHGSEEREPSRGNRLWRASTAP
jgi:hypothetical protein